MTSTPRLSVPLWLLGSALAAISSLPAQAGTTALYHLVPLTVPGATSVTVNDVNNLGQAVGSYQDADFLRHAVLWDADGTAHTLAMPAGVDVEGIARAINNNGQIVGTATDYEFGGYGLLWNATTPGQYTLIHGVAEQSASVNDISDSGVAVGGVAGFGTGVASRAFVWTAAGGLVDYGVADPTVANQHARWSAVNNAGKLVGYWSLGFSTIHATVGLVGSPMVLPMSQMTEDFPSIANAINASGVAVGLGLGANPVLVPVVFAADGTFTEIPGATLAQTNGGATAINAAGVIVGNAGIGSANGIVPGLQAFVHRDGVSHDLFQVTDNTAGFERFASASAINDSGVIAASGRLASDNSVASFLLRPISADVIFASGFDN